MPCCRSRCSRGFAGIRFGQVLWEDGGERVSGRAQSMSKLLASARLMLTVALLDYDCIRILLAIAVLTKQLADLEDVLQSTKSNLNNLWIRDG